MQRYAEAVKDIGDMAVFLEVKLRCIDVAR
jgi:hypothetical protein